MYNTLELIFVILSVVVLSVYMYLAWNLNYWKKRGILGPKPEIIFGNLRNSFFMKRHMMYEFDDIYRQFKNQDKFVGVFMGKSPDLLLIDPEIIREVMVSNFKDFHANEISRVTTTKRDPLVGPNPFLSIGGIWKSKRSEITPAITPTRVKSNYPIMRDVAQRMTMYLEKVFRDPPKDGIEARELAMRFTTDVTTSSIYGLEGGGFESDICRILEEGSSFTLFQTGYNFLASILPIIRRFYTPKLVTSRCEKFFIKLCQDAIEIREKAQDDLRVDLLNYLLQAKEKKNMTYRDIAAHTVTFFLDGFDTSAIAISHVLHMLARNQDIQEKLREELLEALGDKTEISFQKLIELPYLDQVFHETLRLFPPLNVLTKLCTQRHEFTNSKNNKVFIERGTVCIINTYSLHRDENYYPEPDKFIPERFSPENGGTKKYKEMGVFLPFGEGPRVCLGMRFALAQSKTAIAELVLNFKMTVNKKTRDDIIADPKNYMLIIDGGVWLDFKRIERDI